jgi:hypothetical protein
MFPEQAAADAGRMCECAPSRPVEMIASRPLTLLAPPWCRAAACPTPSASRPTRPRAGWPARAARPARPSGWRRWRLLVAVGCGWSWLVAWWVAVGWLEGGGAAAPCCCNAICACKKQRCARHADRVYTTHCLLDSSSWVRVVVSSSSTPRSCASSRLSCGGRRAGGGRGRNEEGQSGCQAAFQGGIPPTDQASSGPRTSS